MPATKGITEQQILKVFDAADDPFLSASEIAEEVGVSAEGVRYHLKKMEASDLVGRKSIGAKAVGWWAKVGPRLDADLQDELEATREDAWNSSTSLGDLQSNAE